MAKKKEKKEKKAGKRMSDRVLFFDQGAILEDGSPEEVLGRLEGLIDRVMCPEVAGIGVGVPSVVDSEEGIVYNVVNNNSLLPCHTKAEVWLTAE